MEEKKKFSFLPIIMLLIGIIIGAGVCCAIFMPTVIKEKENSESKDAAKVDTVEEKDIVATIDDIKYLKNFMYNSDLTGNNFFETVEGRIGYVKYVLFREEECKRTAIDPRKPQDVFYVTLDEFKNKYKEIFGSNYDMSGIEPSSGTEDYEEMKDGESYIYWPTLTYGTTGGTIGLEIHKQEVINDELTVTGEYVSSIDDFGTFTVVFKVENGKLTMKSASGVSTHK